MKQRSIICIVYTEYCKYQLFENVEYALKAQGQEFVQIENLFSGFYIGRDYQQLIYHLDQDSLTKNVFFAMD